MTTNGWLAGLARQPLSVRRRVLIWLLIPPLAVAVSLGHMVRLWTDVSYAREQMGLDLLVALAEPDDGGFLDLPLEERKHR